MHLSRQTGNICSIQHGCIPTCLKGSTDASIERSYTICATSPTTKQSTNRLKSIVAYPSGVARGFSLPHKASLTDDDASLPSGQVQEGGGEVCAAGSSCSGTDQRLHHETTCCGSICHLARMSLSSCQANEPGLYSQNRCAFCVFATWSACLFALEKRTNQGSLKQVNLL